MPELLDMPKEVMLEIFEFIGFPGVFTARQVCKDLKNFIDDVKPELNLRELSIELSENEAVLRCNKSLRGTRYHIYYGMTNAKLFWKDLRTCLRFQRSAIFKISIDDGGELDRQLYEGIRDILNSRPSQIKVQSLWLQIENEDSIISVLQHVDADVFESIRVNCYIEHKKSVELTRINDLDQWKKANFFNFCGFIIAPLRFFEHTKSGCASVKDVHWEKLVELKNKFLKSERFSEFELSYDEIDDNERFEKALGQQADDERDPPKWYFQYPNSEDCLFIRWLDKLKIVYFRRGGKPRNVHVIEFSQE